MVCHFKKRYDSYLEPIQPLTYVAWGTFSLHHKNFLGPQHRRILTAALRVTITDAIFVWDFSALFRLSFLRDLALVLWFRTLSLPFPPFYHRVGLTIDRRAFLPLRERKDNHSPPRCLSVWKSLRAWPRNRESALSLRCR